MKRQKQMKMTPEQALAKLIAERTITEDMLEPLGWTFEHFLQFAQVPNDVRELVIDKLITFYQKG